MFEKGSALVKITGHGSGAFRVAVPNLSIFRHIADSCSNVAGSRAYRSDNTVFVDHSYIVIVAVPADLRIYGL